MDDLVLMFLEEIKIPKISETKCSLFGIFWWVFEVVSKPLSPRPRVQNHWSWKSVSHGLIAVSLIELKKKVKCDQILTIDGFLEVDDERNVLFSSQVREPWCQKSIGHRVIGFVLVFLLRWQERILKVWSLLTFPLHSLSWSWKEISGRNSDQTKTLRSWAGWNLRELHPVIFDVAVVQSTICYRKYSSIHLSNKVTSFFPLSRSTSRSFKEDFDENSYS